MKIRLPVLFLCPALLLLSPVFLLCQDFDINNYDVTIEIDTGGFFDVNEDIQVHFNERSRGIFRDIPYKYQRSDGESITTDITNVRVEGHRYKVTRKGNYTRIRIGHPDKYLTGDVTYSISYRVFRAFNYLTDRTEFYWNVIGHEWTVPIAEVNYKIILPDDLIVPDEDILVLAGPAGSQEKNAVISKVGRTITGHSTATLFPGSALTVAINLPPDYIKKPTNLVDSAKYQDSPDVVKENNDNKGIGNGLIGLFALLGALFSWLYKKYGLNKNVQEISEQYFPPSDMTSAEVGTFYDFHAHSRDLISLIPHWGNQGLIEINSIERNDGKRDIYFRKLLGIDFDAPTYEQTMFNGIFKHSNKVFLTDLKEKYYSTLSKAQSQVKKEIMEPRLYDATAKKFFHSNWSILGFVLFLAMGIFLMVRFQFITAGILSIIIAIILMVIRFIRPKLSEEGLKLHLQLVGLHAFLKNPDPIMFRKLIQEDGQYLDRMLPFAIAFGLDKSWNASVAKSKMTNLAPAWYIYHSGNAEGKVTPSSYIDFSNAFDVKQITSIFRSAPRSTGGSGGGFSGGSSGGGFGGGGGGSW